MYYLKLEKVARLSSRVSPYRPLYEIGTPWGEDARPASQYRRTRYLITPEPDTI